MAHFRDGYWVDLSDDELKTWQRILAEVPHEYEDRGKPEPFGYNHNCPKCNEPLIFHEERISKPYGVSFLCVSCKTVWFESHESEQKYEDECLRRFDEIMRIAENGNSAKDDKSC